ncbi:hypothetical protein CTAYLR_003661 [Chrysophaeum taylorii]|uniref:T-complex protein 1 subunit gamma n=1 Tax=Chrysophaeum taylorii TaxID=2483200 RepID=A0AAD7UD15_9STRA|nr:hypothetical protein CTAYLR_003661 [Chrysophaeum taylorii]
MLVLNANTQRETGRSAQLGNISAAEAVAGIVRSTLGPRSMLKMLLDPMGGIVLTNDSNSILREVDVSHPAAKQMIELSRAQDEEVGDGTTSVIILTGEMLKSAIPLLERHLHPTVIVRGYSIALDVALEACAKIAKPISLDDKAAMLQLVQSCIGTKFSSRWGDLVISMALEATLRVTRDLGEPAPSEAAAGDDAAAPVAASLLSSSSKQSKEVDIKRYAKVEKIPGGEPSESRVLNGVMFNKDVTHPRMRRRIVRPRVLLLDCPLEYKKGDSATNVAIEKEEDWNKLLRIEEEYIENVCAQIVASRPDVVITEKGVSDLAQHYLMKANITAFRRLRKTDNNRVARAVGATIVSRTDEIQESDIGTGCGLFEVRKLGDEYFAFLEECDAPKACTILLRGASKDVLNEVERNLQDAMQVVRNVVLEPRLLPGGGATEMAVAAALENHVAGNTAALGVHQWPVRAVASAMEVIPRILAQNCGAKVVRVLTQLRAKHLGDSNDHTWGIDGTSGALLDMADVTRGIWEPFAVKVQTVKTAIEASSLILRIDDIVSGIKKSKK